MNQPWDGCTCVPYPEPPSHLSPHPIPQGHPSALALSALSHALNLDWQSISHMVVYILISFKVHLIRSGPLRKLFPIWLTQIHYHWKCITSGKFLLPYNTALTDVMDHVIHKVLPTLKERGLYKSQISGRAKILEVISEGCLPTRVGTKGNRAHCVPKALLIKVQSCLVGNFCFACVCVCNWNIIALPYCVSFCCTVKWISH